MGAATNLAKGQGNFYLYVTFSAKRILFSQGDALCYDVYLAQNDPEPKGGIDVVTMDGPTLRDSGATDTAGRLAHGDADLSDAKGKWLHREIPLERLAGRTSKEWDLQFEGDRDGLYVQFVANVEVRHADGTSTPVYTSGPPEEHSIAMREGYSRVFVLRDVERSDVTDGADLTLFVQNQIGNAAVLAKLADFEGDMETALKIAALTKDARLTKLASAAQRDAVTLEHKGREVGAADVDALVARHSDVVHGDFPAIKAFKAFLVGHGHIDFQWLWPWSETEQVARSTFRQACKFMDEFPDFHYTQSSTWLYRAVQETDPALFSQIKKHVANGQWEIVGGRNDEGDTNIISPESHARHFLYGQRYFREQFGKPAVVGWEPDTFGHTLQMPQLLSLAGLHYYYFCRAGWGTPLFWWQAPDGSRVLAFDDGSTGSWYDGEVDMGRVERQFDYAKKTGQKEMMWVYGVGNHGGGPTRENIEAAKGLASRPYMPDVRFSTAQGFFEAVSKGDLSKLPAHAGDLNTTFEGCYTSHSDVKRWNRDAEATTESAEAIVALCTQFGVNDVPNASKFFRRMWETILWNHHHDTIGGTCVGSSYLESEKRFADVMADVQGACNESLMGLAAGIRKPGTLVFNPVATHRREVVIVRRQVPGAQPMRSQKGCYAFVADLPPAGYRVIDRAKSTGDGNIYDPVTHTFENERFRVVLDPTRGVITSVFDKESGKEAISQGGTGNRLEVHWEADDGMSAWNIGHILRVQPLTAPVDVQVLENGPVLAKVAWIRRFQSTDIQQTVTLSAVGAPEFSIDTQWNELGHSGQPSPFLRVAFDVASNHPSSTYDVPFGVQKRAADGKEYPALKWVDFGDSSFGAALINNCKHGYSAEGNTLRMSLIHSSFDPDPRPNIRHQHAEWEFLPHSGPWMDARVIDVAQEFNHPVWTMPVQGASHGRFPDSASLVSLSAPNLFVTGIKLAEDDSDLVVRFYEAFGKTATTAVRTLRPVVAAKTVNLIEDPVKSERVGAVKVRPYEIRTLKLKMRK
jgi:alpha-mannosidase